METNKSSSPKQPLKAILLGAVILGSIGALLGAVAGFTLEGLFAGFVVGWIIGEIVGLAAT